MNSIKILLAAAMIMIASNVLAGCAPSQPSNVGVERLQEVQALKKSLQLTLKPIEVNEEHISFQVILLNPEREKITSAETWFAYNPKVLRGMEVNTEKSAFNITAPYENTFDDFNGLLMMGRSTENPVNEEVILVAEISFERLTNDAVMLESYDYAPDLSGHTSANIMKDGMPHNLLIKPEVPLFVLTE